MQDLPKVITKMCQINIKCTILHISLTLHVKLFIHKHSIWCQFNSSSLAIVVLFYEMIMREISTSH